MAVKNRIHACLSASQMMSCRSGGCWISSWHCASQSQKADLDQQFLRLLRRRHWVVPCAVDREGPTSWGDAASSVFVVALCFSIQGGRASSADFATATAAALVPTSPTKPCENGFYRGTGLREPRGLHHQALRLLWQQCWSSHTLRTSRAQLQLHQNVLRVRILSWH